MKRVERRHRVWKPCVGLVCGLSLALLAGCAAETAKRPSREAPRREPRSSQTPQPPVSDTHPLQLNDYLIYPVKWQRAEDVAATLEPLLQARYGPEAQVIVHQPTNKLLIYTPRRAREGRIQPSASGRASR